MASKSAQHEPEKAEVIEELLDHCDTTLDRVKVLYEQFFLGIQKQPPSHLHTDVERKLRELQQIQIRNTALRYRFVTIQQKFGSYNNYWRRTLRQIESGTYHRNLAKIGRQAVQTGEDIPDEILAAMPKRMREQVKRDREAALATKRRREGATEDATDADFLEELETPTGVARKTSGGAHVLDEDDGEFDLDASFAAVTNEDKTNPDLRAVDESVRPSSVRHVSRATVPPPEGAGASGGWSGPPRAAAANVRIPRTPAFEGELPTEADFDPPTERPQPAPAPAAVRAAVGLRTPPVGMPAARVTQPVMTQPLPTQPSETDAIRTQPIARPPQPNPMQTTGAIRTQPIPARPTSGGLPAVPPAPAPSQVVRPLPVMPGASSMRPPVPVETLSGPFPREQTPPGQAPAPGQPRNPSGPHPTIPSGPHPGARTAPGTQRPSTATPPAGATRPSSPAPPPAGTARPSPPGSTATPAAGSARPSAPPVRATQPIDRATQPIRPTRVTTEPGVAAPARVGPPPGMTEADVNALYAKYVKAKEAVGEKAGPGSYGKLLQTINAQAPKIMEQYKAKGVDFQVVVKDNQVVIRAKPKP